MPDADLEPRLGFSHPFPARHVQPHPMLNSSNAQISSGPHYYYATPGTVTDPGIGQPPPLLVMYPGRGQQSMVSSGGGGVRLPPISSLVGPPASYVPVSGVPQLPPRMVVAAEHACVGAGANVGGSRAGSVSSSVSGPGSVSGAAGGGTPSVSVATNNQLDPAVRLRKQCPVCGKVCSRPSTLKTHFLIHTGDTPFKCTWADCDKSFNVKSNMLRHLKSHERKLAKKKGSNGKRVSL